MTTVSDLIERTRRQLYGSHRGMFNFMASAVGAADTSVTFSDDLKGIVPGAILGVGDEMWYVRTTNGPTRTATVSRGWYGSTPESHSGGAIVEVSPRWSRIDVSDALRDEIRSWSAGVYKTDSYTAVAAPTSRTIDLAYFGGQSYNILSVVRDPRSSGTAPIQMKFRLVRESPDYPYGALVLDSAPEASVDVVVVAAMPFDVSTWASSTELVDDVGLAETMLDIPPIGAAWRLLNPREMTRLDPGSQGEPRTAAEIQGGMIAAVARSYKALRDTRLSEEANRLRHSYGWRI